MTQQALRELVAQIEFDIRVYRTNAADAKDRRCFDMQAEHDESADRLEQALPHLKALLGEQREAQGADELPFMPTTNAAKPTEHMVDEALDGFNTMPATEGLRAQVEHAVERAMWACPVFSPPSKSVWALVDKWRLRSGDEGLHYVLKNALLNHAIELDEALSAPPLAESVGDVKALARELAESIDFTNDRAQARVVFEKILPDAMRRHMQQDDKK